MQLWEYASPGSLGLIELCVQDTSDDTSEGEFVMITEVTDPKQ